MKLCVFFLFKICPWIVNVGDWALRWTEGNQAIQVAFVMLIFPVIMNAMQYYIIDSFIKNKNRTDHQAIPTEDLDEDDALIQDNWDDSFESEDEEDVKQATAAGSEAASSSRLKVSSDKVDEYNPGKDGSDGTAGSSNSVNEGKGKI